MFGWRITPGCPSGKNHLNFVSQHVKLIRWFEIYLRWILDLDWVPSASPPDKQSWDVCWAVKILDNVFLTGSTTSNPQKKDTNSWWQSQNKRSRTISLRMNKNHGMVLSTSSHYNHTIDCRKRYYPVKQSVLFVRPLWLICFICIIQGLRNISVHFHNLSHPPNTLRS